jgi:hypothetical protein
MRRILICLITIALVAVAIIAMQKPTTKTSAQVKSVHSVHKKAKTKKHNIKKITKKRIKAVKHHKVSRQNNREAKLNLTNRHLWMLIHKCEGGWTSRGTFEGGLQFLHSTWVSAGGRAFAEHAYDATPDEQITVANWYSHNGSWLAPWPVCGKRAAKVLGLAFP